MRVFVPLGVVFACMLACTPSHAAYAYVAEISSFQDRSCELMRFDLADPDGTLETVDTLRVGHVKGLVMDSPTSAWIVSSGASDGSPKPGFYRYENGSTFRIAAFDFQSGGWGGLTRDPLGDGLLMAMNDDTIEPGLPTPTLFHLAYDGTLTRVAGMTDGVNKLELNGLATDPVTGRVFGTSGDGSGTNGDLYEIDLTTGAGTLIGKLGAPVFAVGGLDFTPDGRLVTMQDLYPPRLYELDPATGAATRLASPGALNVVGALSFVPAPGTAAPIAIGVAGLARRRRHAE